MQQLTQHCTIIHPSRHEGPIIGHISFEGNRKNLQKGTGRIDNIFKLRSIIVHYQYTRWQRSFRRILPRPSTPVQSLTNTTRIWKPRLQLCSVGDGIIEVQSQDWHQVRMCYVHIAYQSCGLNHTVHHRSYASHGPVLLRIRPGLC